MHQEMSIKKGAGGKFDMVRRSVRTMDRSDLERQLTQVRADRKYIQEQIGKLQEQEQSLTAEEAELERWLGGNPTP